MVIPRSIVAAIAAQARDELPNEACGLLAGQDGRVVKRYPIRNADESPVHYRMEPKEQLQAMLEIDDQGWNLAAIYHSHTHTRAYPSATDIRLAAYPDALYLILSLATAEPDLRGFRIVDGDVTEVELRIEDD